MFRVDIRAATEAAAAAEFQFNGTCLVLMSAGLVDQLADWSEPIQIKVARNANGLVDMAVRDA